MFIITPGANICFRETAAGKWNPDDLEWSSRERNEHARPTVKDLHGVKSQCAETVRGMTAHKTQYTLINYGLPLGLEVHYSVLG